MYDEAPTSPSADSGPRNCSRWADIALTGAGTAMVVLAAGGSDRILVGALMGGLCSGALARLLTHGPAGCVQPVDRRRRPTA